MSVADQGPPVPSLRRLPFSVRLSPQLVNQLISQRSKPVASGDISGLLFGLAEEGSVIAQARHEFDDGAGVGGRAKRTDQDKLFQQQLSASQKHSETAALNLIGWYSIRTSGGLTASDLAYHDWYFPRPHDLALILTLEDPSNVSLELYCRTVAGLMTEESHRTGLVRLSTSPLESAVEVVPRPKIQDDFFMRAYELGEAEEGKPSGWMGTLAVRYRRMFSFLRPGSDTRDKRTLASFAPKPELSQREPNEQPELILPKLNLDAQRSSVDAPGPASMLEELKRTAESAKSLTAPSKPPPEAIPEVPWLQSTGLQTTPKGFSSASTLISPSASLIAAPDPPVRPKQPWVLVLTVFVLTSALTFAVGTYLRSSESLPRFLQVFAPATGLGLKVEAQGDRLLLSWNRQNPLVKHAKIGLLSIEDGTQKRQVVLDASHVANGSILYRPGSDDVMFRLEVHGLDGNQAVDSMRVLEAAKPVALDLSPQTPVSPLVREKAGTELLKSGSALPPTPVTRPANNRPGDNPKGRPEIPKPQKVASPQTSTEPAKSEIAKEEEVQATPEEFPIKPLVVPAGSSTPPAATPLKQLEAQPEVPKREAPPVSSPETPVNYQPPKPLRQVLPNVSSLPPGSLTAAGHLEVVVRVDENGRVTEARAVEGERKINSALIGSALIAARQWKFEPAVMHGKAVPSQHSIVFQFAARR